MICITSNASCESGQAVDEAKRRQEHSVFAKLCDAIMLLLAHLRVIYHYVLRGSCTPVLHADPVLEFFETPFQPRRCTLIKEGSGSSTPL